MWRKHDKSESAMIMAYRVPYATILAYLSSHSHSRCVSYKLSGVNMCEPYAKTIVNNALFYPKLGVHP